jgi:hypothetical protein
MRNPTDALQKILDREHAKLSRAAAEVDFPRRNGQGVKQPPSG